MQNDALATGLSMVRNHDLLGRKSCVLHPINKTVRKVLDVLNREGYVGSSEDVTKGKGGEIIVHLLGSINRLGVIKPRFSAKIREFEKWEKRYLPARGMGVLILSTSQGIMTHEEAKKKQIGGRLLAYCC